MAKGSAADAVSVVSMLYGCAGLFAGLCLGLQVAARLVDDWRLDVLQIGSIAAFLCTYLFARHLSIRVKREHGLYSGSPPLRVLA